MIRIIRYTLLVFGICLLGFIPILIGIVGCGRSVVTTTGGGGSTGSLFFNGIVSASLAELGSTSEVQVTWEAATSESRVTYYIYHSTASDEVFSTTAASTSGVTSYIVKSLEPDTMYYFGGRARNEAGSSESNTKITSESTSVVTGSMKNCFPWDMAKNPKYQLIGIKAFLSPNSSGVVGKDKDGNPQYWYYVFNVDGTKEAYKSTVRSQPVKVNPTDPEYEDITMNFDLNNLITGEQFINGLDSFALMKIVNNDPTIEAWIAAHPDYNTGGLVIINYELSHMVQFDNLVIFISTQGVGAEPGKTIYIDSATGTVKQYD